MSIDSLYEGVISKLTSLDKIVHISKELLDIKTNDERVLYVYYLIRELKAFPQFIAVEKTANVSIHYRNLGNNCFKKSEDYKAWQYYNLSLLHAPSDSEHYALALANRSAVFFSLKKYSECLKDINILSQKNYPDKLRDKLMKRHRACDEALAGQEREKFYEIITMNNILKLRKHSTEYLCASPKLEVVRDSTMGVHVVAKEDIEVGEVLAKETPYLVLLQKSQYLFSCSYCLSRNLNLIPCDKCCFALYCDSGCRNMAWDSYHKIECPLMATLVHMEFTKLELLALRTVIKARTDHKNWPHLFTTISAAEANANSNLRGHIKSGNDWIFSSTYYESIHTLASNIEKRSISDIFQKSVSAAVFLRLLETETDFIEQEDIGDERDKIRRCVAGTLLLHIMTSPTNMHGISSNIENRDGNFVDEISIASAPYAFHSLLNHSCCPNVVRSTKLGTSEMTLVALRPIKKGMQLFDNYGMHHAVEDVASRQASLKFQYKFTCHCEACVNNWPTFLKAKPARLDANTRKTYKNLLGPDVIEKLQKADKATAIEKFKPLCRFAEACEQFAPCKELCECQEAIKQCLAIFEGVIPYGYSQIVDWKPIPPRV